jgi:hypothetical protein
MTDRHVKRTACRCPLCEQTYDTEPLSERESAVSPYDGRGGVVAQVIPSTGTPCHPARIVYESGKIGNLPDSYEYLSRNGRSGYGHGASFA